MEEKPNYFAIIPAEVRYDTNLKDKAKLLYGEITALANKNGYCYASNKYFAELYNVSITTISLLIKNLVDEGYIESEFVYKEGTKEIECRYLSILKGGYLRKVKGGYLRKVKGNNININNTSINNITTNNIYNYIESNYGRTISPVEYQMIESWLSLYNEDIIKYAIDISILNGKKTFKYVNGIINNWKGCNYQSLQEIKDEVKPKKERKYI